MEDILIEKPPQLGLQKESQTFAGIHLSGPNTPKTSVVFWRQSAPGQPISLAQVYEKIGPKGNRFSDDRLSQILFETPDLVTVVVDQALSAPPCVACQRPKCPGVIRCDDLGVASMMAVAAKIQPIAHFKNQVINPQTHRLWDLLQVEKALIAKKIRPEPTYQANLAPLVTRAQVLKKRLHAERPHVSLLETSVKMVLSTMAQPWGYQETITSQYRNFERGRKTRDAIVTKMLAAVASDRPGDLVSLVSQSVETFHAFLSGWIAVLNRLGQTTTKPETFTDTEGWVCLPQGSKGRTGP